MSDIKVGDRVEIEGDTQDYILVDPHKTYSGEVISQEGGQILVRLDHAVKRGVNEFHEVTVPETRARHS
jgi:hypothetical protein